MRVIPGILLGALLAALPASAQTIKMGTVAPPNSPWDASLRALAEQWSEASQGAVSLKIYPGSIAGDELDMVRKMRIGELQAAALSGEGLKDIVRGVLVFDLPFLFSSGPELRYVLDAMTPEFKREFEGKGFVLLGWTLAGWIEFFSRDPVVSPSDLMAQKLAVSGSDPDVVQAWRRAGFRVTTISFSDIMTGLSSGMIDAIYTEPIAAAAYQWFGIARNLCDLRIAPLISGIVVSRRAWERVAPAYRPALAEAAEGDLGSLYERTRSLERRAREVMSENGLAINRVSPVEAERWRALVASGYSALIGTDVPTATFDRVQALIRDYRSAHGG